MMVSTGSAIIPAELRRMARHMTSVVIIAEKVSGPGATPAPGLSVGHRLNRVAVPRGAPAPTCKARLLSVLPLICILLVLAACGTTGIKPDEKLVSSVTSLPPVQVPVPVRCVKEIPPMPTLTIDPNATVLQRYYAMKALLAAQDEYMLRANAVIQGCAEPKP